MATQWFSFNGLDPADPNNYSPQGSTPPTCTGLPEQLCAIHAEDDSNKPVLDLPIALQMIQALQNQANNANVKLKQR